MELSVLFLEQSGGSSFHHAPHQLSRFKKDGSLLFVELGESRCELCFFRFPDALSEGNAFRRQPDVHLSTVCLMGCALNKIHLFQKSNGDPHRLRLYPFGAGQLRRGRGSFFQAFKNGFLSPGKIPKFRWNVCANPAKERADFHHEIFSRKFFRFLSHNLEHKLISLTVKYGVRAGSAEAKALLNSGRGRLNGMLIAPQLGIALRSGFSKVDAT
jgi:hypothetical protein